MIAALIALAAAVAMPPAAAPPTPVELTAPGPEGPLAGTLLDPDPHGPLIVLLPGSGAGDRDGNNPLGVAGGPTRQLAEALAAQGVATLRADKRGLYASARAVADPNAATIAGYVDDAQAWSKVARERTGRRCVWLLGHSEGGLIALQAAQRPAGICGLVLLAAPGRPAGELLRAQLAATPGRPPAALAAADATITALEAGRRVPAATLPPGLQRLFADQIQSYWIDTFAYDPAALIAKVTLPILILQGTRDIQVSVADAEALKRAQPQATLMLLPGVNHVLKPVASGERAANVATYSDAALAISPSVAAAVAGFVRR